MVAPLYTLTITIITTTIIISIKDGEDVIEITKTLVDYDSEDQPKLSASQPLALLIALYPILYSVPITTDTFILIFNTNSRPSILRDEPLYLGPDFSSSFLFYSFSQIPKG